MANHHVSPVKRLDARHAIGEPGADLGVVDVVKAGGISAGAADLEVKGLGNMHGGRAFTGPVVLLVLDGWGYNPDRDWNAIALANTPVFDRLTREHPNMLIQASEQHVGLPEGQMGTSEVGHMTLGAGRIINQPLTRIDLSIREGSFGKNAVLAGAIEFAEKSGKTLHLLGLVSDGGVHSDINHLYAILDMVKNSKVSEVCIHAVTDGRDTPARSAVRENPQDKPGFIEQLESRIRDMGLQDRVRIATVGGRSYYMDRYGQHWDYTGVAYGAMRNGISEEKVASAKGDVLEPRKASNAVEAVEAAYGRGQTDEDMYPTIIVGRNGQPMGKVEDGDSVIFFNFRQDRAIQITQAFAEETFDHFPRGKKPNVNFTCMVEYDPRIKAPVAFGTDFPQHTVKGVLSSNRIATFSIAECYKCEHIGFYFRGMKREPYPGENHVMIPSTSLPATELWRRPDMSANAVTEAAVDLIKSGKYGFGIINYANPDMVGHCGRLGPAIQAVETVDKCMGKIADAVTGMNGVLIVIADHGNAEVMFDPKMNQPHNEHTTNPVPCLVVTDNNRVKAELNQPPAERQYSLQDIAPTILTMMGVKVPDEMTGKPLVRISSTQVNRV